MCGKHDSGKSVDYYTLKTSCINALNQCSSASCVRDYVMNAHHEHLYKFCKNDMNLLITAGPWASTAYGLEYYSGYPYDCVAYCNPW